MIRDWKSSVPLALSLFSIIVALCALAGAVVKVSQLTQELEAMKQNSSSSGSHRQAEYDMMFNMDSTSGATSTSDIMSTTEDPTITGLQAELYRLQRTLVQLTAELERDMNQTKTLFGSSYVRWGKAQCAGDAELVYSGFAGGAPSQDKRMSGGGVQYLCLPFEPEWNKFDMTNDSLSYSWVYAAEYMSFKTKIFDDEIHGHNVVCSVCRAPRAAKMMIPARRTCPTSWTREYEGYLMTSYVVSNRMTFECVDQDPEVINGTRPVRGGALLYHVAGYCEGNGSLGFCPPYRHAKELTCVVCTR